MFECLTVEGFSGSGADDHEVYAGTSDKVDVSQRGKSTNTPKYGNHITAAVHSSPLDEKSVSISECLHTE